MQRNDERRKSHKRGASSAAIIWLAAARGLSARRRGALGAWRQGTRRWSCRAPPGLDQIPQTVGKMRFMGGFHGENAVCSNIGRAAARGLDARRRRATRRSYRATPGRDHIPRTVGKMVLGTLYTGNTRFCDLRHYIYYVVGRVSAT